MSLDKLYGFGEDESSLFAEHELGLSPVARAARAREVVGLVGLGAELVSCIQFSSGMRVIGRELVVDVWTTPTQ